MDLHRVAHKELLCALAERWWPSTNTFHFGWGEMTMTPIDLSCISGIPFGGRPVETFDDWREAIPSARMIELIGMDFPRGARSVPRTTLIASAQTIYGGYRVGTISAEQCARFVILMLLSASIFCNKRQAVDLGIIRSFADLTRIGEYDWAGAILCRLYEEMSALCRHRTTLCGVSHFWEVIFKS